MLYLGIRLFNTPHLAMLYLYLYFGPLSNRPTGCLVIKAVSIDLYRSKDVNFYRTGLMEDFVFPELLN